MKIYEITIKPITPFATPLKGDTIFGNFCWQIFYDKNLLGADIDELLSLYSTQPFAIFSSAYIKCRESTNKEYYILKRPDVPLKYFFDFNQEDNEKNMEKKKEFKSKKWMQYDREESVIDLKNIKFYSDSDEEARNKMSGKALDDILIFDSAYHNKINRLSGSTGEEGFAPFSIEQHTYFPEVKLAVFVYIADMINIEGIVKGFERIGTCGFGKDSSAGMGKYEVVSKKEVSFAADSPNALYTLSPSVPEKDVFVKMFYVPFVRFGKHGDILAISENPFKNPVIMADEGAVFIPKDKNVFEKPYIGTAVSGLSKVQPNAVAQGYSIYLPINIGGI